MIDFVLLPFYILKTFWCLLDTWEGIHFRLLNTSLKVTGLSWVSKSIMSCLIFKVTGSRVPRAKYTMVREALCYVIPYHMQCSMGCGGQACKYEDPSHWTEDDQAVRGIYSSWYTACTYTCLFKHGLYQIRLSLWRSCEPKLLCVLCSPSTSKYHVHFLFWKSTDHQRRAFN